jgi:hypothetical protein
MSRPQRNLVALLLVVGVLLACGICAAFLLGDEPHDTGISVSFDDGGGTPSPSSSPLEPGNQRPKAGPRATESRAGATETGTEASDQLSLTFQDFAGSPKAGVTMKLVSAAGEEDVTTGPDGRVGIAPEHASYLTLTLVDADLNFRRMSTFSKDISFSERALQAEPTIIVYEMLSYQLDVRYEDGIPWQGKLVLDEDTSIGGPWHTEQLADGHLPGFQVPAGAKAYASAKSLRAEFCATAESWIGGEADPAVPIVLTLKRDPEAFAALLLIDLSGFSPEETVVVCVHDLKTNCCMGEGNAPGGEIHVIGSFVAGSYKVSASSRKQGWNSGSLSLKAVETLLLKPDLMDCGSIVARVTGEDGQVLPDTRLFIRRGVFPRWKSWLKDPSGWSYDGVRCSVDESGDCELFGVPPGPVEVEIAGRHSDSFVGTYDLAPGQRLDLGEIRLAAAKGAITVQLSNFDANTEYTAQLYQTGGASVDEAVAFNTSGYAELKQVPMRAYTLIIRPKGGGVATFRKVELTPTGTDVHLDIEMPR